MNTNSRPASPSRRQVMATGLAGLLAPLGAAWGGQEVAGPVVEIWKAPGCGCCEDWMKHLAANGLRPVMHDGGNAAVRARVGIDDRYASCHTALVAGYALEGHVPAREIHRLLKQRPAAVGLAVPGMPIGSPGMDGAIYGGRRDPFDVLLIARNGQPSVYESYR